ncbi:MAG: hypothetical protein ICV79_16805 [Flavisolibacter sp.]|nr:hypothetical protein [Flavisolibacter sp.]
MKEWIGYILSLYILFCAVVPCTIMDNCEQSKHSEQASNTDTKKDCNNCSPFSMCASCHGFTLSTVTTAIEPVAFNRSPSYSDYYSSSKSEYYSRFFQPPRLRKINATAARI